MDASHELRIKSHMTLPILTSFPVLAMIALPVQELKDGSAQGIPASRAFTKLKRRLG